VKTSFSYHYIEYGAKENEPAYKIASSHVPFNQVMKPSALQVPAAQFAVKHVMQNSLKKQLQRNWYTCAKFVLHSIIGLGGARNLVKWVYENKVVMYRTNARRWW
jgi:hypothetical protein